MQKNSPLPNFFSENRWILLGLTWLVGLALGYLGFTVFAEQNGEVWSAGDIIYRTLQLLTMNSGAVDGKVNWMLEAARFLLPLLTVYTFLQALMHLFREQTQKLRLMRFQDHAVICGLGRKGSHLAQELLDLGKKVVIIEKEPNLKQVEIFRSQGAIILCGDATNKDVLTNARILHARNLVCLLGSDSGNLQTAYQAYQLTHARQVGKLTCIIHLASIDLLNLVRISELSKEPGVPFELETFNPYQRTARMLLQDNPRWFEVSASEDTPISLLVVGLGRLGEQLVIQAGYQWFLSNRPDRLGICVIDRDAEEKTRNLLRKFPQLGKVCDLVPLQADLTSIGPLQNMLSNPGRDGLKQAYVCLRDPVLSLQVCLNLLQIPGVVAAPIWVRLSKEAGLSSILEKPLPGLGDAHQIRAFDIFEYACSAELVLGGMHEMIARDLHEIYSAGVDTISSRQTWEQLPEAIKDANRQQASRIHQLLEVVGYRIYPLQDWDAGSKIFSKAETEKMASQEHALWCQVKESDGWSYGKQRDDKMHTHPDLVPWEELPKAEQEKNLLVIRQLPALLARIGFEVGRIESP